ncbi:MAG TPA: hypothetical protein VEH83_03680 [Gemmatimonadales bacterium]|nr:hypothetical protein [Gemmatimonadales bacterium]
MALLGLSLAGGGAGAQVPDSGRAAAEPGRVADATAVARCAIARRSERLLSAGAFRYAASTKLVVRDAGAPADSGRSVLFLGEILSTAYARHPGVWQETVVARRRWGGPGTEGSAVGIVDVADFDRDRVPLTRRPDFGPGERGAFARGVWRRGSPEPGDVSVALPLADGATDRYDFRVVDTLVVAGRRALRLAVAPRSGSVPLFEGTMEVADSGCDLLALDLGLAGAAPFPSVTGLRYQERLDDVGGGRWLPVEIRLSGEARPRITGPRLPEEVAGIPVPRLPGHVRFEEVTRFDDFRFEGIEPPEGVDQLRIVVRDDADRRDDSIWTAGGAPPLSEAESAARARADSLERRPPTFLTRAGQGIGFVAGLAADPDFFHYNRVDGTYLGAGHDWQVGDGLVLRTKLGYGLGSETWQYEAGGRVRLSEARRTWLGWSWHDDTRSAPTLVSAGYNPTYRALFARLDPLDYYRERGLGLTAGTDLFDLTRLEIAYLDARQSSLPLVVFGDSTRHPIRPNPPVADGRLRSVSATLTWDSRQLRRERGTDRPLGAPAWTRVTLGAEVSAHDLLASDFSYRRWSLQIERRQRTLWGTTTVSGAAGVATGWVPPQRYFTVDYGMEFLTFQGNGFNTLAETNYSGTRAAMVVVSHEFDRLAHLPFTLSVHGGAFWTGFVDHPPFPGDSLLATAPRAYTEAGFGVGNLTPFLSPFDLAVHFTWQLSSYPTRRFRFGFSVDGL